MRLKAAIVVAMGMMFALSVIASEPAPEPPPGPAAQAVPPYDFTKETLSGCGGSPLVKKRIILIRGAVKACKVQIVVPPLGCVLEGGVIRWEVQNNCQLLEEMNGQPALKINNLQKILPDGTTQPADWLEECEPEFDELKPGRSSPLFCDVPAGTGDELYKYDLVGPEVDSFDPWIEVRRGG